MRLRRIISASLQVGSPPVIPSKFFFTSGALAHTPVLHKKGYGYKRTRLGEGDKENPLTKPSSIDKGALHVVSVPIGNLKDFSYRALEVLREVDYIVTTDRPATKSLLDLVNVPSQGRLIHYSVSNQSSTQERLVELLKGGRSMALVTTSGTPCVGDVGSDLVQAMQADGVRVTAVPGPSALLSALAVSGVTFTSHERPFDPNRKQGKMETIKALSSLRDGSFFFGNMLPESSTARLQIIRNTVATAQHPCVFYEIPRRILPVLQDIASLLPQRRVYITHELTKMNESLHSDTAERLTQFYLGQEASTLLKMGQLVIVIGGATPAEVEQWVTKEMDKRRRLRQGMGELMSPTVEEEKKTPIKKKSKLKLKRRRLFRKKREAMIKRLSWSRSGYV
ncbi:16S rRNA (cytidine1402-2'-O)-methyltransferase [Angomonas deanei]|uniref:Tetrapyrrole (Corrin/Porphyrin) Methylases, putative n=1 Tax=Angomonas deanei TaxID=59799 RepID=A0A7G2CA89_9TRYP|nr:16S rRNA (cytidine1402-2'-O)-methyltransferase [Angomonas deanei]CAD2216696.1 Tetrapyrrole (Corrin/Porphyrin) Methylases, putative [Angomonas deanei]|eukprot:EPY42868.1 16S rRNA (cytidine1402-2'-O)-methyltransferase [Angomonas deanei]